jgi:predicted glutamine amidotransferase
MVRTTAAESMQKTLHQFSAMCEKSRTSDGDRQGDGWGVSWLNGNDEWQTYSSLKAIWDDTSRFQNIPNTKMLVAHARSASFAHQKGILEYNQPYINTDFCFTFNGTIRGMRTKQPIPGKIGAQKIFSLFEKNVRNASATDALKSVFTTITQSAKQVVGLNIGVSDKKYFYLVSDSSESHDYFSLYKTTSEGSVIVCSEPIGFYTWESIPKKEVVTV